MPVQRQRGGVLQSTALRLRNGGGAMALRPRTVTTTTYAAEKLGAGGWVTGLSISPDGNTRLVRTDTLGGWRWDAGNDRWAATITATTLPAPYNVLDISKGLFAIAAANDRAYMAFSNAIFTSTDRGANWSLSLASAPATSANISGVKRYSNHMSVDPNNSSVCLYGTVNAGLYYTTNGGTSWTQVPSSSVPIGLDGLGTPGNNTFGVLCTLIDAAGNWYAAPWGSGLYRSVDQGANWTKISVDTDFVGAVFLETAPNGDIAICGTTSTSAFTSPNARVFRYRSGTWTNITPTGTQRTWKAISYDPTSPGRTIVQADGGYIQLSTNYGTSWTNLIRSFTSGPEDVQWLAASNDNGTQSYFSTIGGLQWDPVVSGRIWMSQGIGVWYADPGATTIVWKAQSRGIEQLVVNDVLCPPGGRTVATCWDRPLMVVGETSGGGSYPYQYHPDNGTLSSGWHADYSAADPTWLAASVWDRSGFATPSPGYSADGGLTWTNFATIPTLSAAQYFAGSIHVGAPGHIIWLSAGSKGASYTTNSGTTWTTMSIPGVTMTNLNTQAYFYYRRPIASEKTAASADTFYVLTSGAGIWKSTDVGANWTQQCTSTPFAGNDWAQMAYLKSVPDQPGHLFITPGWQGAGGGNEALGLPFKRSTDGGVTWSNVSTITSVRGYDFGKAAPGQSYPAIYAIGWVGGVKGVYRSIDNAASWTLLTTQPNGTIDFIRNVGASKDTYGKHWIATGGSGLIVGQLS